MDDSSYDQKLYGDNGLLRILAFFFWIPIKPKVDFLLTIPVALVANTLYVRSSYGTEDGNMDCFVDPELFVRNKLFKFTICILLAYVTRFLS